MKKMKKITLSILTILILSIITLQAQNQNAAQKMMELDRNLTIGGYAQIDYNQGFNDSVRLNGKLDVHRLVMLFGYKFNKKTQFITEIELEHVVEVYVEQAFVSHTIKPELQFRGGLMLVPMGIQNEYHEPTTYNGVERTNIDKNVIPTTWRELGAGFTGRFNNASLRYQAYVMNGFLSYDGSGQLKGSNALRSGRQKGAESIISSPNFSAKVDYYGLKNLNVGVAGYFGNTQSTAYNGIGKSSNVAEKTADSTVVGVAMVGANATYKNKGFQLRGQYNFINLSNTAEYNAYTGQDMGSQVLGYYAEVAYNLFQTSETINTELIPFVRYESYDTHASTEGDLAKNKAYSRNEITFGLGYKLTDGAMLKADYQILDNDAIDKANQQLNLGVAIWFY